jgi:hypothetical protein
MTQASSHVRTLPSIATVIQVRPAGGHVQMLSTVLGVAIRGSRSGPDRISIYQNAMVMGKCVIRSRGGKTENLRDRVLGKT